MRLCQTYTSILTYLASIAGYVNFKIINCTKFVNKNLKILADHSFNFYLFIIILLRNMNKKILV